MRTWMRHRLAHESKAFTRLQLLHDQQSSNTKELSTLKRHKCRAPSPKLFTPRTNLRQTVAADVRRRTTCDARSIRLLTSAATQVALLLLSLCSIALADDFAVLCADRTAI